MKNKFDLRKFYLQKRKSLRPDELEELNERIASNFEIIPLTNLRLVHVFYPIAGKTEVDSLLLKQSLERREPQLQFVLSKSNLQEHSLSHILWTNNTPLSINSWGITEPQSGLEISPGELDMIIIPLLAFDKRGNRLGYGKGFYDRFLAQCRPDAKKIGVSFFEPEDQFVEVDANDVPLDACVTPEKIWQFNTA